MTSKWLLCMIALAGVPASAETTIQETLRVSLVKRVSESVVLSEIKEDGGPGFVGVYTVGGNSISSKPLPSAMYKDLKEKFAKVSGNLPESALTAIGCSSSLAVYERAGKSEPKEKLICLTRVPEHQQTALLNWYEKAKTLLVDGIAKR